MALGGGSFIAQNKILPGSYINVVSSAASNPSLSDRGIAAVGINTGWGVSGEIFEISNADFQKNSLQIFGLPFDHVKLKGLRDLFLHASTLLAFRLDGGGDTASNDFATALYPGTVGNSIKITVRQNVDDDTKFDVITFVGSSQVDSQTVSSADDLVPNKFVTFKSSAVLSATAASSLSGGTDSDIDGEAHQSLLDALEAHSFNALACVSDNQSVKALYAAFCKRVRDEMGQKCQVVVHNFNADYEGVINVKNSVADVNASGAELVWWVTGVAAGTPVNSSASNMLYDGEYSINSSLSQKQLESAIQSGEFTFHKVGNNVRVLTDINSLVSLSDTKGSAFKSNQTIRVIDQIANDIAVIFNSKYLGSAPNDDSGRSALWMDIVKHHSELLNSRAIQDFKDEDISINQGDSPTSVVVTDAITPVHAMEKLYMTVTVS